MKDMGVFGNMHTERKLTCKKSYLCRALVTLLKYHFLDIEFSFSGHMTPRESFIPTSVVVTNDLGVYRICALGRL